MNTIIDCYARGSFATDVHCILLSPSSTPLIKLNRIGEETGCNILVKAEHLNPGGSVKDRAALFLIRQAEQMGEQRLVQFACKLSVYFH